ncbi:UDP-glucose 4-epimerase [Carboxydocella sporoproducens DSM 16521]|uniref:UDP-glucose 4-epimerase n=2 Tax=Carboxydocella TaxID=178898 RepID=A0A1T4L693_9FIRM|nr:MULTISPECIES: UDP-glucose 4-epimerase GalE [Carboxydocella]AVX19945.1 UDP-glucose 4-epimerase [Carboxydocella thermautotrophica]SJZ50214.1 UDP-glucose 4-epimerase [Carboxydocella sporoproducens DSM 16521]
MNILVTGGAGYIGSHTVHYLLQQGHQPIVLDNLSTGHRQAVPSTVPFYHGDIADSALVTSIIDRHQICGVIHFAASSLVGESMIDPAKYFENNVVKTILFLNTLLKTGVKHLVFSSTAAVYGEPRQLPIREEDLTEPTNVYGQTKLMLEQVMAQYARTYDFHYAALRYFNACGALPDGSIGEDHQPETHLIPLILQVANGRRDHITIYGQDYPTPDGTCIRDYIHVLDLAEAHLLALQYLWNGGESGPFNLGNGQGFSVQEVISLARQVTGHPLPVQIGPRRPGDPARLVAAAEKARQVLSWQPRYPDLAAMVASAWAWHRQHPDGFK